MSFFLVLMLLVAIVLGTYVLCYNTLMAAKVSRRRRLVRRHRAAETQACPGTQHRSGCTHGTMGHEQSIVDKIVSARSQALEALATDDHAKIAKAEAGLSQALGQFVAYTEDNPEITANENLLLLQKQLEETEDQVAAARRIFNGNVQAYNTRVASIPWNLVAGVNNMKPARTCSRLDETEMKKISEDPSVADLGLAVPPQSNRS